MLIFFYFFFVVTIHSFAKTPTGGQSYTVVDSIEEGTTFNLQYIPNNNSVKLHVCSVLNEDYIRNIKDVYNEQFEDVIKRPYCPEYCQHNAHMYNLLFKDLKTRTMFIDFCKLIQT